MKTKCMNEDDVKRIISMVLLDLSVRVKNNPWIDGDHPPGGFSQPCLGTRGYK